MTRAPQGGIRQVGYVVRDIYAALDWWVGALGVGPFFVAERIHLAGYRYRGALSDPELTVALAQAGALQIELIAQHDDAASSYGEFLDAGCEGLHHIAYWTTEYDRDLASFEAAGASILQSTSIPAGDTEVRSAYFQPHNASQPVVELSEITGFKGAWFRSIAEAATDWDGHDPVRISSVLS